MLKSSVSGVRGIYGEDLTPEVITGYISALARLAGPGLYPLARDTRPHGEAIYHLAQGVLLASGADVLELGVVPTPTLIFHVKETRAPGGVMVSASHNPQEWNALKLILAPGRFPLPDEVKRLDQIASEPHPWPKEAGRSRRHPDPLAPHLRAILESGFVRHARGLRVAVDAVEGAGSEALPRLIDDLQAEPVPLYCSGSGRFPHNPEPKPENLRELDEALKAGEAHAGLAVDPDADRLVVGFKGEGVLSEEFTLPLVAYAVLKEKRGPVVTNYSTSMMVEEVARWFGVEVVRVPVGEAFTRAKMEELGSPVGGEGAGGIIISEINFARDALAAAGVFLSNYWELREVYRKLPKLPFFKLKFEVSSAVMKEVIAWARAQKGAQVSYEDGVYVRGEGWWVHIRPSNTEPVIRLYAEGRVEEKVKELEEMLG